LQPTPQNPSDFAALKGRRVLITGGLGFVGSNLAHACVAQGAEVTLYDCLDPRSGGNRVNVGGLAGVRVVVGDIRSSEGLAAVVPGHDFVFHCAAYTSHRDSMKEPHVDIEVNCVGTLNLLEALRRFNPEAMLVHLGTSTQTGPMRREILDEDHPEFPVDIYSANKSISEKYVLIYARAYGLRASVVRLSNTYGPRSNIRNPDLGFMNYFIGLALQGKELRVFGDGAQKRTVIYVGDAVDALLRAAVNPRSEGRVYFAVGDASLSVAEIAREIADGLGGTVGFTEWPVNRAAIEVGDAAISNRRIREELGASFPTGLREGLALTRAYFIPRLGEYL
jgi:UDP-glucose 4-epimerase